MSVVAPRLTRFGITVSRANWLDIMLAVLAVASVVGVIRVALTLDLPILYGTEGWVAYHAVEAASGLNPYPPPDGLYYNNYPPIGFYIVGWLGKLTGDTMIAGRTVSLFSFLVIVLGVGQAARLMGCALREAAFAALLSSTILLYDYTYVGLNDPHILGLAFETCGLVFLLRMPRTNASIILAAIFFAAGFFTKHALVTLPLVAGIWLLVYDRRNGLKLALAGATLLGLGMAAFRLAFGRSLWAQLNDPRVWVLQYSVHAMVARSQAGLVPLAAAIALLKWFGRDKYVVLCVSYLVVSLLCAAYFLGGAGVGSKMLYDAVIALSLCGGIGLNRIGALAVGRMPARPLYATCHFLPVVGILIYHPVTGTLPPHWWSYDSPAIADTERDIAFVKSQSGPAFCMRPTLCFWAGKPAGTEAWGYVQAVTMGVRDGHELREAIAQRRYAVLQLLAPPDILGDAREVDAAYVQGLNREIAANYRLARKSFNGWFWVPKDK